MTTPVASTATLPVQAALFTRLSTDPDLVALVSGVFDEVPEGEPYPYVVIGDTTASPDNVHGGFGRTLVATLHVWSAYRGFAEALAIADRLIAVLDHQPLTVPGHQVVAVRHELTQPLRDPDPDLKLRHIVTRFRITTQQE